jgi:uncharacterized membrane protein YeaQ/YmgE (transglycosylase-associated protein family)
MTLGGILALLVVGIVAGWLAGLVLKRRGFGLLGNLALGIVGAIVGGLLFQQLGQPVYGFLGDLLVAFVGALLLVGVAQVLHAPKPSH